MKIRATLLYRLVFVALLLALLTTPAHAFRMLQNTTVGTVIVGAPVPCTDTGGFMHWEVRSLVWRINPALQGATAGGNIDYAIDQWNNVSGSEYRLARGSATGAGFTTDGSNTMVWAAGNGCTGFCLGITALTIQAGQVIVETDISFNTNANWTNGSTAYDLRGVAAHELGHSLGIHHTDVTSSINRPTMRGTYFNGNRTIENDDKDALRCSRNTYTTAPCINPCPTGGVYDSNSCYMWTVPGVNRFLWNENMYYQASTNPNNRCPTIAFNTLNNTTFQPWFDNASCVVRLATGGNQLPFLWGNSYYLSPVCRP